MPVREEKLRPEEQLDLYTGQTLDEIPTTTTSGHPPDTPGTPSSHYINPFYRLDLELKKRGFTRLKSPNYLNEAQGRRRGNYGPSQPQRRFADYDGTVYIRKPAPNYIWVEAAWIPAKPSNGTWCAYWSPTPDGVVSKCGATEDIAVDILLELINHVAKAGQPRPGERRPTLNLNLPGPKVEPSYLAPSGEQVVPDETGQDIHAEGSARFAHVRLEDLAGEPRIVIDVWEGDENDPFASEDFQVSEQGVEKASEFISDEGFRQKIVLPR